MKLLRHKIKNFFVKLPYRFSKTKVRAVHDSDLMSLIESLGIKDEIKNGVKSLE